MVYFFKHLNKMDMLYFERGFDISNVIARYKN